MQAPLGALRLPVGTEQPGNGSLAWLAPQDAVLSTTASCASISQGKDVKLRSTKPAGMLAQGWGLDAEVTYRDLIPIQCPVAS